MKRSSLLVLLLFAVVSCNTVHDNETSFSVNVRKVPILALKNINKIADISITSASERTLCAVKLELKSDESLADIQKLYLMSGDSVITESKVKSSRKLKSFTIPTAFNISETECNLCIGIRVADEVNMDNKIQIGSVTLVTDKGSVFSDCKAFPALRMAVALRQAGQDGVHTSRIPGLVATSKGTLIAIYDARRHGYSDLQGDIDICCNRSVDGGRTWSEMTVAMDMGEWGGLPQKFNGVSDPCILVDRNNDAVFISACWMYGVIDLETGQWVDGLTADSTCWNHQWRHNGTHAGFDVKESSQWVLVKSTDDGLTWSEPMNFTKQVKPEQYCLMINAPGAGITMSDGTLVFPAEGRREDETHFSTIIYSRDGGESWNAGTPTTDDHNLHSNESTVVQLSDGSLMLNSRSDKNHLNHDENGRLVYVTDDLGKNWKEHPTSGHVLTEPTCQASLLMHEYIDACGDARRLLFFFNPADPDRRVHHSLKCSLDEGMTWPEEMTLELDENYGAGYSSMASIDNETIGILYEGSGASLVFQRIKLVDILSKLN